MPWTRTELSSFMWQLMYKMCACCQSVSAHPYTWVFSQSSCPLSHFSPRMTGGLSWLPPTITSVWESLATEGQDLVNRNGTDKQTSPTVVSWGWTWHMLNVFWYSDLSFRLSGHKNGFTDGNRNSSTMHELLVHLAQQPCDGSLTCNLQCVKEKYISR